MKEKEPIPSPSSGQLTRRNFVNGLAMAGAFAADASARETMKLGPDPLKATGADIGTLYDEIAVIADRCDYPMSLLTGNYGSAAEYRKAVQEKVFELLHYDPPETAPQAEVVDRWETDEYIQEKILFNTTPWFRVPAYVLIPKGFSGKRPAIVDLHCHAGAFVFGKEKVMPLRNPHPAHTQLVQNAYDGRSTSAELAKRGYVVISIDRFYFGERRTLFDDLNSLGMDLSNYSIDDVQTGPGGIDLGAFPVLGGDDLARDRPLGRHPYCRLPGIPARSGWLTHRLYGHLDGIGPDQLSLCARRPHPVRGFRGVGVDAAPAHQSACRYSFLLAFPAGLDPFHGPAGYAGGLHT